MAKLKIGKAEDLNTRITDPVILRDTVQQLFEAESEFPIKVEGANTLPYFSTIKSVQWDKGFFILKLVRPLPHELLTGALFHVLCTAGEQRFECFITFQGREGYLQYRFHLPQFLTLSDRRNHKRYPFRPRESAYVILQDSGMPGLGVAGPLVNFCQGGLAMRVDRVIRLDTGVRIPPSTAIFDRGRAFPRINVQDLPRVHFLEARGLTTHATDRAGEVILGLNFSSLQPEETALINQVIEIRDRMQRGILNVRIEGGPVVLRSGEAGNPVQVHAAEEPAPRAGTQAEPPKDPQRELLARLRRRTSGVALVMTAGAPRAALEARLRECGFLRLQVAETMDQLAALVEGEPRRHLPRLVMVDLGVAHAGDAEPLEAVRSIEHRVAGIGAIPTVILCEAVDPTLLLSQAERTRFLGHELTAEALKIMDGLLDPDA